jgi:hypothetical protein
MVPATSASLSKPLFSLKRHEASYEADVRLPNRQDLSNAWFLPDCVVRGYIAAIEPIEVGMPADKGTSSTWPWPPIATIGVECTKNPNHILKNNRAKTI